MTSLGLISALLKVLTVIIRKEIKKALSYKENSLIILLGKSISHGRNTHIRY